MNHPTNNTSGVISGFRKLDVPFERPRKLNLVLAWIVGFCLLLLFLGLTLYAYLTSSH